MPLLAELERAHRKLSNATSEVARSAVGASRHQLTVAIEVLVSRAGKQHSKGVLSCSPQMTATHQAASSGKVI